MSKEENKAIIQLFKKMSDLNEYISNLDNLKYDDEYVDLSNIKSLVKEVENTKNIKLGKNEKAQLLELQKLNDFVLEIKQDKGLEYFDYFYYCFFINKDWLKYYFSKYPKSNDGKMYSIRQYYIKKFKEKFKLEDFEYNLNNKGEKTMSRVITISYQKGGTGKTTLSVNLAAYLANMDSSNKLTKKFEEKNKVLLIDLDPHSNSTKHLGLYDNESYTFRSLLRGKCELPEAMVMFEGSAGPHGEYEIACLRSNEELNSISENDFKDSTSFYCELDTILKESQALDYYDYIIIDCPPSTKELYANGIYAADYFLCPTTIRGADYEEIFCTMDEIDRYKNKDKHTALLGVVINMQVGKKTTVITNAESIDVVEKYKQQTHVFNTAIPNTSAINHAYLTQQPVISFFYGSGNRQRGRHVNRAFKNLAVEIIENILVEEDK